MQKRRMYMNRKNWGEKDCCSEHSSEKRFCDEIVIVDDDSERNENR